MQNVENEVEEKAEANEVEAVQRKSWLVKGIAGLVVVAVLGGGYYYSLQMKKLITKEEAKAKIEKLIKDSGDAATTVKDAVEEGGLYKVVISSRGQDQSIYVAKDGTKFFPQAVSFEEIEKQKAEADKLAEAEKNVPKSDKPVVDLYVMSFCPYGNKAEDTMKPVYDLLKNKVDFNFQYIVSVSGDTVNSLHGAKEVAQNEREACVLKDYGKDKWFGFVSYVNAKCGADGACWEAGAKSLGLNTAKITACVASDGLALMKSDAEASDAAGASGSPTLKINGVNSKAVYQYGNPEALKKAICDTFNTVPAECSKTLVSQATAAQTAATGGSCATQ